MKATGQNINRGAGYGLEVLFVYRLYSPKVYVPWAWLLVVLSITIVKMFGERHCAGIFVQADFEFSLSTEKEDGEIGVLAISRMPL